MRLDHITPRRFVRHLQIPLRRSSHPWLHSSKERTLNETSRKTFHQTLVTRLPLCGTGASQRCSHPFPGGYSAVAPPDPIPNSEVKRSCADGSVNPHARVGHRQGLYPSNAFPSGKAFVFARHVRPPPAIQAASAPRCEVHRHAVAVHLARHGASARPIAHRYNDAVPSVGAHPVRGSHSAYRSFGIGQTGSQPSAPIYLLESSRPGQFISRVRVWESAIAVSCRTAAVLPQCAAPIVVNRL